LRRLISLPAAVRRNAHLADLDFDIVAQLSDLPGHRRLRVGGAAGPQTCGHQALPTVSDVPSGATERLTVQDIPNPLRLAPSALHKIYSQPAQTRLLVFRLHVGAGLAHGGDDAVERDAVGPIPVQGQRRRGDRLDRAEGVALDAWDLHQPADRIAGYARVMLHRDLGGVFHLGGFDALHEMAYAATAALLCEAR
jgi:hypothetical protein